MKVFIMISVALLFPVSAGASYPSSYTDCMGTFNPDESYCLPGSEPEGSKVVVGKNTAINEACWAHDAAGREVCMKGECQFTGQPSDVEFADSCTTKKFQDPESFGICLVATRWRFARTFELPNLCDTNDSSFCMEEGTGGNGCHGCFEFESQCGCGYSSPDCDEMGGICNAENPNPWEPWEHEGICGKPTKGTHTRCLDRDTGLMDWCGFQGSTFWSDECGTCFGACLSCYGEPNSQCTYHTPPDNPPSQCTVGEFGRERIMGAIRSNRGGLPGRGINYDDGTIDTCLHANNLRVFYWRGNFFYQYEPRDTQSLNYELHGEDSGFVDRCTPGQPMPGGKCLMFDPNA